MISEEKWAANLANAQKSTGPRTPEGKARSAQNASTHGLTAKHFVVPPEDLEEFNHLRESLVADIKPSCAVEWNLFEQVLRAAWDIRRIGALEAELYQNGKDPLANPEHRHDAILYRRYLTSARRCYDRALNQIRKLQTDLAQRYFVGDPALFNLPRTVDTAKLVKLTKRSQPGGDQQAAFERMMEAVLNAPMPSIDESPFRSFRTPQKDDDPTRE